MQGGKPEAAVTGAQKTKQRKTGKEGQHWGSVCVWRGEGQLATAEEILDNSVLSNQWCINLSIPRDVQCTYRSRDKSKEGGVFAWKVNFYA